MSIKKPPLRRMTASAGAVALALVGIGAASTAATADVGPDQPGHPNSGSVIIHKYVADQSATPSDGTEQEIDGTPLRGVEFTIWQLGTQQGNDCTAINLAEAQAWNEKLPAGVAPADIEAVKRSGFCVTDTTKKATGEDGSLTYGSLDLGLYYVAETDVSGAADPNGPVNVVSPAAPFYVTIPLPHSGNWVYNVHAYPKNQVLGAPTKTLSESDNQTGLGVGESIEYTISQTVPKLNSAQGETYESASLWDNLGSSFEYGSTAKLTLNGAELVNGKDYEILEDGALVSWKLTGALDKLKAGDKLEVVFNLKVLEIPETGQLGNPGSSDPTKPGYGVEFNGTPGPEGPTPYTYWGALEITKTDENAKALSGAEFQIYPSVDNKTCETDVENATGLVSTGVSGDDGVVKWDATEPASSPIGLFVANSSNGELANPTKVYCLYETQVPVGFTGVKVQTVTVAPGSDVSMKQNNLSIENVQKKGPDLPLTGAQGTLAMSIGGLLLIVIGAVSIVLARRREANTDL